MTADRLLPETAGPPEGSALWRQALGSLGYLALAAGVLLLLAIAALSVWLAVANRTGLERASRDRVILESLRDVSVTIEEAESGQRGFLLTGKESYLEPYAAAVQRLPGALATVQDELAGAPDPAGLFAKLRQATTAKIDELRQTVELARAGRKDAALAVVQTDFGKNTMDRIQAVERRIRAERRTAFLAELDAIDQRGRLLVAADIAALAGVVLLAAVLTEGLRRHLRAQREAEAELSRSNLMLEGLNQELERRVGDRTTELTEANEEIQRFAYIVSHDLRAPLVNIVGFTGELEAAVAVLGPALADLADRQAVSPEVIAATSKDLPEAIHFIKASTAKMDRLIGAILKLAREGRRVLTPEFLDMRRLLTGIADSLQHQTEAADARIEIGAVPDLVMDRLAAEQVFGNLIDNALKYLAPGRSGQVRITGRQVGNVAVFEVSDNGRGIAPQDRERVFELFRRAGGQTVPGDGIGLAHVRALVRRLGGRIELVAAEGVGSTFRVQVPVDATRLRNAVG